MRHLTAIPLQDRIPQVGKRNGVAQGGFLGTYEHNLDSRGRLAIPSRYQGRFEQGGILLPGPDNSLELYPADEFEEIVQRRIPQGSRNRASRDLRRALFAQAFSVQLNSQGRILIPQTMRDQRGLNGPTVITGMGECLEIWSAAAWTAQQKALDLVYNQLLEDEPITERAS